VDPFTLFSALQKQFPTGFSPFCHGHFGWFGNSQQNSTFIATDVRVDCVQFVTTKLRSFGEAVAAGDLRDTALVFDEVNSLGLTVRCRGNFKVAPSMRGSAWAARSEAPRRMYLTLERFKESRTQILPDELRILAASSKANINATPESFLLAEYFPSEVEFLFLGGADRCHTALRYKRKAAGAGAFMWETAGFHAA
jgi:hypothetical protein